MWRLHPKFQTKLVGKWRNLTSTKVSHPVRKESCSLVGKCVALLVSKTQWLKRQKSHLFFSVQLIISDSLSSIAGFIKNWRFVCKLDFTRCTVLLWRQSESCPVDMSTIGTWFAGHLLCKCQQSQNEFQSTRKTVQTPFSYIMCSILQVYAEISIISQSTFNTQLRDSDSSNALLPDNER